LALRRVTKKLAPTWLRPFIIKSYLSARGVLGQVLNLGDTLKLEFTYHGQEPRVYFPVGYARSHNVWRTYATHPPLQYSPYRRADLCHWINRIPDNLEKPCIAECEHILALAGNITNWQTGLQNTAHINHLVEQEKCCYLFTYSAGLVAHSRKYLHPDLWSKFGYLYPVFPAQPEYEHPAEQPFRILVIASRFSDKGVPEAVEAFRVLRQRHGRNVEMSIVTQAVPRGYQLPEGVTLHDVPRMSETMKRRMFQSSHVLLLPCYSDTVVPIVEACAFGVPVITTRIHHGDEFVKDGETGYLIKSPAFSYSDQYGLRWKYWEDFVADIDRMRANGELQSVVEQIIDRVELLIPDLGLQTKMRTTARQLHASQFSPEARNRQLIEIYRNAIGKT